MEGLESVHVGHKPTRAAPVIAAHRAPRSLSRDLGLCMLAGTSAALGRDGAARCFASGWPSLSRHEASCRARPRAIAT
eukprot:34789-Chlamydomonas_euryale.AAC.1